MSIFGMKAKERKIFVDMDDCLADFSITEKNSLERYKTERGFFLNLAPTCFTTWVALRKLQMMGYELFVLTHSPNEQANKEKMMWIERHYPRIFKSIICTLPNVPKSEYVKNNILIDNWNGNLVDVEKNGGIAIKTQFHNKGSESWEGYKVRNYFYEIIPIIEEIERSE